MSLVCGAHELAYQLSVTVLTKTVPGLGVGQLIFDPPPPVTAASLPVNESTAITLS
jgi:hypothetical protein